MRKHTPEEAEAARLRKLEWRRQKRARDRQALAGMTDEDHWQRVLSQDPYTFWRMMNIRRMIEHRGLYHGELGEMVGKSKEWVGQSLRPSYVRFEGEPFRVASRLAHTTHERLDLIEEAITDITRDRGGLLATCGCTYEALVVLHREIEEAKYHDREEQ